jgi:hypothetical protein
MPGAESGSTADAIGIAKVITDEAARGNHRLLRKTQSARCPVDYLAHQHIAVGVDDQGWDDVAKLEDLCRGACCQSNANRSLDDGVRSLKPAA